MNEQILALVPNLSEQLVTLRLALAAIAGDSQENHLTDAIDALMGAENSLAYAYDEAKESQ